MSDIERELEEALHRVLDPVSGQAIPPLRVGASRMRARAIVGGAGAALTMKLVSGVVVAAAAVTVAGTAATGSANPEVWGRQVSSYVSDCRSKLADGHHGIGDCVAPFASTHGSAVASDARQQGQGSGAGSTNAHGGNPNANDHAKDKTKPEPTSHPIAPDPTDPSTHPQVTPPAPR